MHWLPPASLDELTSRTRLPRAERTKEGWLVQITEDRALLAASSITDLEGILTLASSVGVDVLVTSPPTLAEVQHLPGPEAGDLLRGVNEQLAAAQSAHPDRFVGLATLPMQDPGEALSVLDHAVGLRLRGVMMHSSIEGRPIATDETLPVFKRLDELRMPVILHPAVRSQTFAVNGGVTVAEGGIFWMAHTSAAAFNLIESGTLDACPNLVVLHPHLGGVLPYLLGRLERIQNERHEIAISEYLRTRFFTDTVGRTPGQIRMAMQTYGTDRVLFGSDNPFEQMAWMKQYVSDEGVADVVFANVLPGLVP